MPIIPRSDERQRLPRWMKRRLAPAGSSDSSTTDAVVRKHDLHTICEEGTCPNRNECYSKKVATFLLMGDPLMLVRLDLQLPVPSVVYLPMIAR